MDLAAYSNIGSFCLAATLAIISIASSRKIQANKVYNYLEILLSSRTQLEESMAEYIELSNINNFNVLNIKYSNFVNTLEYFSSKIINENLYKTAAFKKFANEVDSSLLELVHLQLDLYNYIQENSYETHGIVTSSYTRRRNLQNTFKLLNVILPKDDIKDIDEKIKKYELY